MVIAHEGNGGNEQVGESGAEDRIKRTALTRDARRHLDQLVAARLLEMGFDPYKPSATGKAGSRSADYEPDLRARWVFPTIGLSRAARVSTEIAAAAKGLDLSSLRLITLRPTKDRPEPHDLDRSLESLSQDINTHVPYMIRMGWIVPVLSVPQIRLDHDGGLDLHLHALWHLIPDSLDRAVTYLEERYTGGVWVDDKPVRSLRKTAFYIASGMLDYPAVPEWPDHILGAIWQLGQRRMIRRAGWFAEHFKKSSNTGPRETGRGGNIPVRRQEASVAARRVQGGDIHPRGKSAAREAASGSRGPASTTGNASEGKKARNREHSAPGGNISTVRPAAPESEFYNLSESPTIDELWTVLRLLESGDAEQPRETLSEFCARLSLKPLQVRRAVSRVESYFEANLFYPGRHWQPTDEGLALLSKGFPHLQGLDALVVDLGADARWAREPGRKAFEARIGNGGVSSEGIEGTQDPKDE